VVREMADAEALELAIIENVQRADLNVLEEATAYQELMERFGRTQEQVAQEVGKSRSHIANSIRLLRLPDSVQILLREGKLTAGHARTLLGAADPEAVAREILAGGMNVRQAEQRSGAAKKLTAPPPKDPNIKQLESSISNRLGLTIHVMHKVDKSGKDRGGEVRISYKTLEQLDEIARRLGKA
jgi:ParB family chromosome partitioning protein